MKTAKKFFVFGVLVSMFLSSCTMQKCVYSKGYYVDWFGSKSNGSLDINKSKKQSALLNAEVELSQEVFAAEYASSESASINESVELTITQSEKRIATGEFSSATVKRFNPATQALKVVDFQQKEVTEVKAEAPMVAKPSGGKSQIVALLICFFIGALGIHRFYLGYTGIGIIQLLTLGGCGIWALIDLIMIITGDLKPNGGEYDKTF